MNNMIAFTIESFNKKDFSGIKKFGFKKQFDKTCIYIESRDMSMPDLNLVQHMFHSFFEIYSQHYYGKQYDYLFWDNSIEACYLKAMLAKNN